MADPAHLKDVPVEHRRVNDPPPLEGQAEILNLAHILIRDTSDRIVFWNTGAEKLYLWTRGEALGRVSHELLQTQFAEPLASIRAQLWRDGLWKGELLHRRRDGKQIVVASHWGLHRNDQGLPRAILEVNNDITELKHSPQTIQQLNTALANAMPGISRLDSRGRYTEVNEYYAQMLGYASSELLGKDWRATIYPEDQPTALQAYERLRNEGKAEFEAQAIRKDGSVFFQRVLLVAIADPSGKFAGHYGFMCDITDRKHEEQLRESRERLRAFAIQLDSAIETERVRISREIHDGLGQALTTLAIDLAWLNNRVRNADREGTASSVGKKIASMSELVDSVIGDIRRIASDLRPPLLDKVGLSAAIETHAWQFQERTGIRCHTTLQHQIDIAQERAVTVFRIYQEAMTNVARHAGANRVAIKVSQRNDVLTLEVQNDGRAISKAEASNPHSQGILGMQERARILGGSLSIIGIPGAGTVVRLETPKKHVLRAETSGQDEISSNIRILIADDHPLIRQGVKQIFMEDGLEVAFHEAHDVASMQEHIYAKDFDLLLLDLSLPGKNGLDCVRELKRIRPNLPILVLSMYSDSQFALPALKAGAAGYLTKERAPKELVT
ncbi:MAG: PAS domain S-box protein, partial [Gammaproteobacteria bacterium]